MDANGVISLHVGHNASWVGSYLWSIRDSTTEESDTALDLYYNTSNSSYNPRCIFVDSADWNSSGYEQEADLEGLWDGSTNVIRQEKHK